MSTQVGDSCASTGSARAGAEVRYEVTAEAIRDYAAATRPTEPPGGTRAAVFAIVPVWDAIAPASKRVATDEARKRVVHASQDMVLHRPIEAGMKLVSTATPVALLPRGSGSALVIHTETKTEDGELVNEQWVTEFFRGIDRTGEPRRTAGATTGSPERGPRDRSARRARAGGGTRTSRTATPTRRVTTS